MARLLRTYFGEKSCRSMRISRAPSISRVSRLALPPVTATGQKTRFRPFLPLPAPQRFGGWVPGDLTVSKRKHSVLAPPRRVAAPEASEQGSSSSPAVSVTFNHEASPDGTVINIFGQNQPGLLMQLTSVFMANDIIVNSANITTEDDGSVCNIFCVTDPEGNKIASDRWPLLDEQLTRVMRASSRSSKPSIFGAAVIDEMAIEAVTSSEDADELERAAKEMSEAASTLVRVERELIGLVESNADKSMLLQKQTERGEASSQLERRMAAMEAILISRRTQIELLAKKAAEPVIPSFFQPPPTKPSGPAAGTGYEIILQGFNWESCKEPWYQRLAELAPSIAEDGFTAVWMPPSSDAVSAQGYLPRDYYDLNSKYGSEAELRQLISVLHDNGLKAIADIVINHRCAHYQGNDGKWNKFGGRLAWDNSVVCSNNPAYGGTGGYKQQEDYPAAPNLDHNQERVRKDIIEWMRWLRNSIGFDGWRFDFVKGYDGRWVGEYVNATVPEMAFGEYWDTCSYSDGVLSYNQDGHRQRTVDWCDATGGACAAFDFTLKGILQEAVARKEYWRLVDAQGRPSGLLGVWPSRAVTFLENHDTGSTLQHWPFPWKNAAEGYAYLLTHPGSPCVFWDHYFYDENLRKDIQKLVAIRKQFLLNYKSVVAVKKAYNDVYAAVIDNKVAVKIGPGNWSPSEALGGGIKEFKLLHSGHNFAVWEAVY
ncbi:hypothetical protein Ndes2526A_g01021 [Nannochloris sp. 'desiccata']